MDGLSLLCNLHSDGPLALRRLHAAGVRELHDLEDVPEATLTACLRSSRAHARRFVVEARQLALRLAESPLEPEPAGADGHTGDPLEPFSWRGGGRQRSSDLRAEPGAARATRVPAGEHVLQSGAIEGLDARTCERLAGEGVHTLEALQERAGLALARNAGIPLWKLLDLAALARLALTSTRVASTPDARVAETPAHELVPQAPRQSSWAGWSLPSRNPAAAPASAARLQAADSSAAGPFG